MTTKISNSVTEAIDYLNQGEIIAIPTETVYGLAGNAYQAETVIKIFEIKNRPFFNPLIVHTYSIEKSLEFVANWHPLLLKLAEHFTPGALTFLLPKKDIIPDLVTAGSPLVAVRIPKHPVTLTLLENLKYPLAAPSANPFGYVSPTSSKHVLHSLNGKIPLILEGGPSEIGLESTIIGAVNDELVIYRLGGVPIEAIEKITGKIKTIKKSSSHPDAPGMLIQHYAPHKKLIVTNDLEKYLQTHKFDKLGIIFFGEEIKIDKPKLNLSPEKSFSEAAKNLFGYFRAIEEWEVDYVVIEWFEDWWLGKALNDRIRRAASEIVNFR